MSEHRSRVEALARHLARAAGWNDENTPVPVWQTYLPMAEAALEWWSNEELRWWASSQPEPEKALQEMRGLT
jgi:hypothetical protein